MTRETKVGLLVGMAMILLIGIIVSDHLSVAAHQDAAFLPGYAEQVQRGLGGEQARFDPNRAAPAADLAPRHMLPMPGEAARPQSVPAQQGPAPVQIVPQPAPSDLPLTAYALEQQRQQQQAAASSAQGDNTQQVQFVNAPTQQSPLTQLMGNPSVQDLTVRQAVIPTQAQVGGPAAVPGAAALGDMPARIERTTPPPASDFYTVKAGDSLYAIAQQFYGDGEYWKMIVEANREKVGRDGSVQEGVKLVLPNRRGLAGHPDFVPVQSETDRPTLAQNQVAALQRQVGLPLATTPGAFGASGSDAGAMGGRTVTVEAGQTLSQIAGKHLGSSKRWKELLAANSDQIKKPEELREGMELRLPATAAAVPTAGPQATLVRQVASGSTATPALAGASGVSGVSGAGAGTYTVKPGDSLSAIAERTLGSRGAWKKLYEANRNVLADPDSVEVGATLTIPRG